MGGCCATEEMSMETLKLQDMELESEEVEKKPKDTLKVVGEPSEEPELKEKTPSQPAPEPIERDPQYIFSIKFKKKPIGVVFTSDVDGTGAYVTEVDPKRNKASRKNKLP